MKRDSINKLLPIFGVHKILYKNVEYTGKSVTVCLGNCM